MNPSEYQRQAARTECDQVAVIKRFSTWVQQGTDEADFDMRPVRLAHAVLGLSGEVGELSAAVERWLWYGKDLDVPNIAEELGDLQWYVALACNALGLDLAAIMEANIRKLRQRYPHKWTGEQAAEENRDREAERQVMTEVVFDPHLSAEVADKLKELVAKTLLSQPLTVEQVQAARATVQGCCERHADNKACDCLEKAQQTDQSWEKIMAGKRCETCGQPATQITHDTDREYTYEEHHYYCNAHKRPAKILPTRYAPQE